MRSIAILAILAASIATPAYAANQATGHSGLSVGVSYGLDNVIGLHGEYDLSASMHKPFAIQGFLKSWSVTLPFVGSVSDTALGAVGIINLREALKINDTRIKPYVGIGLEISSVNSPWLNANFTWGSTRRSSLEVSYVGGIRYSIAPNIELDANYNDFGGVSVGAFYRF